ncbi:Pyruvate phosphate dikinase, PEP/pyruvate binding domain [Desulfacinum hydrothermale DSM 13146]|uniref:Phosphoenolpyruvate synthase n=1 Tax=Desulfacinum hydrothermale DSM 13146 TaxID=1121390 RepID=A0A1W1XJJ6_9BACT|nr:PEP/pyruvate-binding domain-containing protein [Desulfacinum hydrothermale]SMC23934.1 Pyruvate phosphate dikinase, PEP/pyruvate binding domain [Desulfacinum hydrothermale DSM 13146]
MKDMAVGSLNRLLRTYDLFQKMMQYPKLLPSMRRIFLSSLIRRGVVTEEDLERKVREVLDAEGLAHDEANRERIRGALIDLLFASHFSEKEAVEHINLARKQDQFTHLNRVVNAEGATARQIQKALKAFCAIPQGDLHIDPSEAEGVRVALINHFISNQLPFIGIAKKYITIRDIDELLDHTYSCPRRSGRIGGKAAGMLLAYKILVPRLSEADPELKAHVAVPESYYFNSGIFSDFIDHNGLHAFHSQKYKSREAIEEDYQHIAVLFEKAVFPPDMVAMFRKFLQMVGEHPLILRSSSLLEDNFGHAFSGKYDSVFLVNHGSLDQRLKEFLWGLKRVHMSTYGPAPILYRRDHNLLDFDEKMSVLVQKVVGQRYGDYFLPFAAGVGFSRNTYRWTPKIRSEDGLVRLVLGLGTRAVDRVAQDYPRLVALSHPGLRPEGSADQIIKYSQRMVDVLNLKKGCLESIPFREVMRVLPPDASFMALSYNQDGHLAPPMFKGRTEPLERSCITFDNFLQRSRFVPLVRKVLKKLDQAYGWPVDVEFAWDQDKLYLLQCRTLSVRQEIHQVSLPTDVPQEAIVFTNSRVVFNAVVRNVEVVVYVDPKAYGRMAHWEAKRAIGRVVSRLNRRLEGRRYALFGPGRWGSNDINLGVRVGYEDINRTLILGEIAFQSGGITPEVSFGTHFFNDLVEARIVPVAIHPDQPHTIFNEDFFTKSENRLAQWLPDDTSYQDVVHVIHVPSVTSGRYLHVYQDAETQKGIGFLAPFEDESP